MLAASGQRELLDHVVILESMIINDKLISYVLGIAVAAGAGPFKGRGSDIKSPAEAARLK